MTDLIHPRRRFLMTACLAGLLLSQWAAAEEAPSAGEPSSADEVCLECRGEQLGTSITWHRRATDAARLARQEDKLVFLIQVSGNFAREEFT